MKTQIIKLFFCIAVLSHINGICQIAAHVTNSEFKADPKTRFAQNEDYVFFRELIHGRITMMSKTTWNAELLDEFASPASSGSGILWSDNKLFYIDYIGNIVYYSYESSNSSWLGPFYTFSVLANLKSDLAESTNHIYFVDQNCDVRGMSKSTLNGSVIVDGAPLANDNTDLLWTHNRLFYVSKYAKIYYYYWTQDIGWQVEGHVGNLVNTESNLEASANNLYFIDQQNHVRSMGIGEIGQWWNNHVIDSFAPLALSNSDLFWHDGKLFYITFGDDNISQCKIVYFYWDPEIEDWVYCNDYDKFFIKNFLSWNYMNTDTQHWSRIHQYSNFARVDNEILFVDYLNNPYDSKYIYRFRSPIKLTSVVNNFNKPGWKPVYWDEFNEPPMNTSLWLVEYYENHWYNHPVEKEDPFVSCCNGGISTNNCFSLYYNELDWDDPSLTSHIFDQNNYLSIRTESGQFNRNVQSCDINQNNGDRNDGNYQYKSGMLNSKPIYDQLYGYFEIRCRLPLTNKEKFCFWLYGGKNSINDYEIDVFETPGHGEYFPTNYWIYYENGDRESDGFTIYPVVGDSFCSDEFYTYAIEWNINKIIWYINNEVVRVIHKNQNYPSILIADGGMSTLITTRVWDKYSIYGVPDNFPNNYDIDYIRVYKPKNETGISKKSCNNIEKKVDLIKDNTLQLEFFPNPATKEIFINVQNIKSNIYIYNCQGKKVREVVDIPPLQQLTKGSSFSTG